MTTRFQPAGDNILVHLFPIGETGPDDAVEWAEVIAAGPGWRLADGTLVAPDVTPGDRIALRPHSALRLCVDGLSMAVVSQSDVLGVLLHPATEPRRASEAQPAPAAIRRASAAAPIEESLETDVAPDRLDQEAPTAQDLH